MMMASSVMITLLLPLICQITTGLNLRGKKTKTAEGCCSGGKEEENVTSGDSGKPKNNANTAESSDDYASKRVIIGGNSQGGTIAAEVALRYIKKENKILGGLAVTRSNILSRTYEEFAKLKDLQVTLPTSISNAKLTMPIFLPVGISDSIYPLEITMLKAFSETHFPKNIFDTRKYVYDCVGHLEDSLTELRWLGWFITQAFSRFIPPTRGGFLLRPPQLLESRFGTSFDSRPRPGVGTGTTAVAGACSSPTAHIENVVTLDSGPGIVSGNSPVVRIAKKESGSGGNNGNSNAYWTHDVPEDLMGKAKKAIIEDAEITYYSPGETLAEKLQKIDDDAKGDGEQHYFYESVQPFSRFEALQGKNVNNEELTEEKWIENYYDKPKLPEISSVGNVNGLGICINAETYLKDDLKKERAFKYVKYTNMLKKHSDVPVPVPTYSFKEQIKVFYFSKFKDEKREEKRKKI